MDEEKFWEIIGENKKYINSDSYEGKHEYTLRLAFQLKMMKKQDCAEFITTLYRKFHILFTSQYMINYALLCISPEFSKDDSGKYTFILNDGNSKKKLYNWVFISNYRDFRYNLIRNGKESYNYFRGNPSRIYDLMPIAHERLENSIFKIEQLVDKYRYYNFKEYNYGTFIQALRANFESSRMMEKIMFGDFVEDSAEVVPSLPDYTKNQSFSNALDTFSESEKNTILNCIKNIGGDDDIRFL